jgi:DNA-binding NarL/FixJ family response regulator
MHGQQTEPGSAPVVLGVDDFATCKGKTYGTILVDIEKQQVVDLLPGRQAEPLTDWLQSRPSVSFITRDRAPAYAEAAASGAPQAVQVADRFHLLVNLTDAMQRFFDGQADCLRQAGSALSQQSQASQQVQPPDQPAPGAAPMQPGSQPVAPAAKQAPTAKQLVFNQVKELQAKGHSSRSIARQLSVSRTRVTRYMSHEQLPGYSPRVGGTKFSPFLAVIEQTCFSGY